MNTGEVPGYEFEVPRGSRHGNGPRHAAGHDYALRQLRRPPQHAPAPKSPVRDASSGVLAVMLKRNWLLGLAAPILAAIAVGIAAVVVAGGGGGGVAPSALAAGFPPARLAGADFTGTGTTTRVILDAIGASAGTEVAAGVANGGPALWVSADGGTGWTRAALGGPASLSGAGGGELAGVAHGPAGWVAVGTTLAAAGGPLVVSSPDARKWTAKGGIAGLPAGSAVAAAVAAGPAGYVIVGHQTASRHGAVIAAAWYAPGLSGWRSATVTGATVTGATVTGAAVAGQGQQVASAGQLMNAVTATARGYIAVGSAGTSAAAWLSADGRSWQQVSLAEPAGAARAALEYVAANGASLVAAGTEFNASGATRPFAEVSANAGATWTPVQLPEPDVGRGTGSTVTALTAAVGGFTAAGTYMTGSGPEVVIWTLPPGTPVTAGAGWTAMASSLTPHDFGPPGTAAENAVTALTTDGATLTGVGFSATVPGSGPAGTQQPTLWQSPIRY
jgi:hypothetical protein